MRAEPGRPSTRSTRQTWTPSGARADPETTTARVRLLRPNRTPPPGIVRLHGGMCERLAAHRASPHRNASAARVLRRALRTEWAVVVGRPCALRPRASRRGRAGRAPRPPWRTPAVPGCVSIDRTRERDNHRAQRPGASAEHAHAGKRLPDAHRPAGTRASGTDIRTVGSSSSTWPNRCAR
jgi:hypothetical protein